MRIAVLRCQRLPRFVTWEIPNLDDYFADDRMLIAEFATRGIEAVSVSWADPGVDWDQFDLALIRSTWDYIDEPEHFMRVLAAIEGSSCMLFNPLKAVRWNGDKRYLFDLSDWGVPTVPTYRATPAERKSLQAAVVQEGWRDAVVKPTIGAAGSAVHRVASHDIADTLEALAERHPHHDFLVQPLVESVITEGEWSFIYVDRELSHVLLKKPGPGDYRVHGIYGGTIATADPASDDRRQAEAIRGRLPFDLLYARLDLVRVDGRLAVMELELVEPILYFDLVPEGVARLVAATMARLQKARSGARSPRRLPTA